MDDDEYVAEAVRRQGVLREQLTQLDATKAGTAARDDELKQVFAATEDLLGYEQSIPGLRDARRRRVSSALVYAAGGAATAAMAVLGVLAWLGTISRWYFVPVVVVFLVAGGLTLTERTEPVRGHRYRMIAVLIVAATAVLVILVAGRVLSAFWLPTGVLAVLTAGGFWISDGGAEPGEDQT